MDAAYRVHESFFIQNLSNEHKNLPDADGLLPCTARPNHFYTTIRNWPIHGRKRSHGHAKKILQSPVHTLSHLHFRHPLQLLLHCRLPAKPGIFKWPVFPRLGHCFAPNLTALSLQQPHIIHKKRPDNQHKTSKRNRVARHLAHVHHPFHQRKWKTRPQNHRHEIHHVRRRQTTLRHGPTHPPNRRTAINT